MNNMELVLEIVWVYLVTGSIWNEIYCVKLQTLQDEDIILTFLNNIRGVVSSVKADRYVKSDENKKILYVDANNLYGWAMSEYLPYNENRFDRNVKLEEILNTPDDSDLRYPNKLKEKTKSFPLTPENKKNNPDDFSDYMKTIKPDTYTQTKKSICDWFDKKNYLVHYRLLKLYVRHGMKVERVYNVFSFKQSEGLGKYISSYTQKRSKARNEFEKDCYISSNNSFHGKTMQNFRNRIKVELIKKDDNDKIIKQQSKITINGIHGPYTNYDSYTFKQNEVLMDKPSCLGFAVLELSKLLK